MTEEPVFFDNQKATEPEATPTPKKAHYEVQRPSLILPGLILVFLVSLVIGTGYMVIRNRLYKKELNDQLNRPKFSDLVPSQKPTQASPSSQVKSPVTSPSYAPGLVDGGSKQPTTKGGLPLAPTPTPTAKPAVKGTSTSRPAPTASPIILNKFYLDAQFPYRISFTDSWHFQRTYGTGAGTSEDQIQSAVELTRSRSRVSLNLLRGRGISDIATWIKNTPYSEAPNVSPQHISFKGHSALRYSYTLGDGRSIQKTYFIKGATVYRLVALWETTFESETKAILNSFVPDTKAN